MEHCIKKCVTATVLLVIAIIAIILSCYLIGNGANCWVGIGAITIAVLSMLLIISLLCCPCNEEPNVTKEKMDQWIRESISNNIHRRLDDCSFTCLNNRLDQDISELQKKITKKIDNVHLVQAPYLSFLKELSTEIGKSGNAWKKEDIERFMQCFESVTKSLKEITSED